MDVTAAPKLAKQNRARQSERRAWAEAIRPRGRAVPQEGVAAAMEAWRGVSRRLDFFGYFLYQDKK